MASKGKIQKNFFGMHVSNEGRFWPTVPIVGTWRSWDQVPGWASQQPTRGSAINFDAYTDWEGKQMGVDASVNVAIANGAEPILTLGLTPSWASLSQIIGNTITGDANPTNVNCSYSPGLNSPPQDINDWINYVTAVGNKFKGRVFYYEIWNEINVTGFFSGTIGGLDESASPGTIGYGPGSDMYNLVKTASIALKAIDPRNKIISPSFVGQAGVFCQAVPLLKDLIAGNYIDVIAVHLYTGGPKDQTLTWRNSVPEKGESSAYIEGRQAMAVFAEAGIPKNFPIWNTEAGFLNVSADGTSLGSWPNEMAPLPEGDIQCGYMMRSFLIAASQGYDRMCLYAFDHSMMGMIEPSTMLAPGANANSVVYKATVGALLVLQKWLVGRYVSDIVIDRSANKMSVQITDDNGFKGLIVWNTNSSADMYKPPRGYTTITRYMQTEQTPAVGVVAWPGPENSLNPPFGPTVTNPISLAEGAQQLPTYNTTYRTGFQTNKYRVLSATTPANAPAYSPQHILYSGWGEVTKPLPLSSEEFFQLNFTPVLLT